jgi:hypothetical protein
MAQYHRLGLALGEQRFPELQVGPMLTARMQESGRRFQLPVEPSKPTVQSGLGVTPISPRQTGLAKDR